MIDGQRVHGRGDFPGSPRLFLAYFSLVVNRYLGGFLLVDSPPAGGRSGGRSGTQHAHAIVSVDLSRPSVSDWTQVPLQNNNLAINVDVQNGDWGRAGISIETAADVEAPPSRMGVYLNASRSRVNVAPSGGSLIRFHSSGGGTIHAFAVIRLVFS